MSLLEKLPPSSKVKCGWPWSEDSQFNLKNKNFDKNLPTISIVTVSLNQGEFIEETIRSVLLQNYPKLEYIIIDGGSSDNSIEIIEKYEHWLTYWVSEEDKGQSEAINKGFKKANGEIYAWLNSDDILLPGALYEVGKKIDCDKPDWIIGACEFVDNSVKANYVHYPRTNNIVLKDLLNWGKNWFAQPSVFWSKGMLNKVGLLDEELHFVMDVDYWFRMVEVSSPKTTSNILSRFRKHENSKTISESEKSQQELVKLISQVLLKDKINCETYVNFIVNELFEAQKKVRKFENIYGHIIIGKFIKLWKYFINRNLQTN